MLVIRLFSKLSSFQRVLLALVLGIAAGIVVGEPAGQLEILGNAYIRLLQMTVLPYVLVSIIGGLGRLDASMASSIGIRALKVMLMMWLAVMLTLLLLPLAYPNWETGGFFSSSQLVEVEAFNFLDLYIPANIFSSLSNTIVPAVVLFSLLMGISLIHVKNKETLLDLTMNISDGLMGVASFVAKLAPLGIFAISAAAAGTLQPEDLNRLQIFLWVYLIAAVLLAFVLLPLLIHWATPFSYRELYSIAAEAMVTAIATGTVLVVLPMIAERCKAMLEKHSMTNRMTLSTVDVMVPTAYSFPSTGTLLGLGFILFSGWYMGSPLGIEDYLSFVVMGALAAFGSMAVAIPFLLDHFGLPADQFQLYLLGSIVTARFATGLAALHGFVITLLVASAVLNRLKWTRFMQVVGLHLAVTSGVVLAAGMLLMHLIPYEYTAVKSFESMHLMGEPAPVTKMSQLVPLNAQEQEQDRLELIRERGTIRVAYAANRLPYAFRNNQGMVVGFDMELLHALANDLNLKIEIYRLPENNNYAALLVNGSLDMVIGGQIIMPQQALDIAFSDAYSHHTLGFVVKDARRNDFSSLESIQGMEHPVIAMLKSEYYQPAVKRLLPNAKIVTVESIRQYTAAKNDDIDAFAYSAEAGAAWAMLYPEYASVIAKGVHLKAPIALSLPKGQGDYLRFINTWLRLKDENGFQHKVYNYWILGENPQAKKTRWSVLHNVLEWN